MEYVFKLDHIYKFNDLEEVKFIGVFSTESLANETIDGLIIQPGFKNFPRECFEINTVKIDSCGWQEGFISWDEANEHI